MSKQLSELIQAAEQLTPEEQLRLIAHLAQNMSTGSPSSQEHNQPASQTTKTGKSIWQIAEDFTKDLSQEELSKLPTDGAEQHDHYIYGTPKRTS
ncbi:MAG: hypothetical protein KME10_21820 [Plectolyngbya sp. WJT66-NPBG17]|jgi:hypothetical protein|nr:hypothetical protein [Plectolyngbya sp. WJT66-NPBG17]MBW4528454.1 hypothetical protein [Phormidium tanganyikae FI6-MK23]